MANSAMPWVKLYTDFLIDPKVVDLSRPAKLTFIELVLLAGICDCDGLLVDGEHALKDSYIARMLSISTDELAQQVDELAGVGLVVREDGALRVVNFSKRQGRSQSDKREQWRKRQAKARAKVSQDGADSVTRDASVSHATRVDKIREEGDAADAAPPPSVVYDADDLPDTAVITGGEGEGMDASTDFFNRATAARTPARVIASWKCADHLKDLCVAFAEVFNLEVTKDDRGKWIGGARHLNELAPTRAELIAAKRETDGLTITHPYAIYETVKKLRASKPQTTERVVYEPRFN